MPSSHVRLQNDILMLYCLPLLMGSIMHAFAGAPPLGLTLITYNTMIKIKHAQQGPSSPAGTQLSPGSSCCLDCTGAPDIHLDSQQQQHIHIWMHDETATFCCRACAAAPGTDSRGRRHHGAPQQTCDVHVTPPLLQRHTSHPDQFTSRQPSVRLLPGPTPKAGAIMMCGSDRGVSQP